ncbi:MAG: hypothetical protein JNK33_06940, partial [Candidatus Doudnabacteria bacterium]|nr:hypothetical protein [Candidatus Doudnabacteria bacterium]
LIFQDYHEGKTNKPKRGRMKALFDTLRDCKEPDLHTSPLGQSADAPDTGSFFIGGEYAFVPEAQIVPCEEPLPGVLLPYLLLQNMGGRKKDLDHGRFESADPRLQGERRVLRYAQVQLTQRSVHERKHQIYRAVRMPETPAQVFQTVLFGAARYVGRNVLDLSGTRPNVHTLTDSELVRFHREGSVGIQPGTQWRIGYYIAKYALENGLDAIRGKDEVEKFLAEEDETARRHASFQIMRLLVDVVADPVESAYEKARRNGGIRRPEPTISRFVARYFKNHQPDYVPSLVERLAA